MMSGEEMTQSAYDEPVREEAPGESAVPAGLSRSERAMENFLQGYNCAQAVVLAYADLLPLDEGTLSKLSCSFGGGMGRLREVCGSVSGAFMVLGLLCGYEGPETGAVKADHYAKIQELARHFEAENGSIVCRELLGLAVKHDTSAPSARTEEYYKKRPCKEIIGRTAAILETYLKEIGAIPEN